MKKLLIRLPAIALTMTAGITLAAASSAASSGPSSTGTTAYPVARFSNWATQDCISTNSSHDLFSQKCRAGGDAKYSYQQWEIIPGDQTGVYLLRNVATKRCLRYWNTDTNGVITEPCDKPLARQNWFVEDQKILSLVSHRILYDEARTSDIRVTSSGTVTPANYGRWSQIS
ncbi:hypothetical protein [Nonomuraea insulae]|uniref:Ricin B lectin domain-containing protein n=1 Tax=Nonomuraea insulae TaxID=1616787 RepID=A0ABW1DC57_9ACTN